MCVQIIDSVMPRRNYSEVSLMGLPQEQIGASRDIAHSLLFQVDDEFEKEGNDGRYTRYMDDILIGVKSPEEGERCISRLQRGLESLGLYPNAAKTTVNSVDKYLEDAMVATNAEVDRLNNVLDKYSKGTPRIIDAPQEVIEEIKFLSDEHRNISEHPKRWGRVTRRIYTLHRSAGINLWWEYWRADIDDDPGAAAPILEYVRAWPLLGSTVDDLVGLSSRYADLYANISILAAEAIVSAPVPNNEDLWTYIYAACQSEFSRLIGRGSAHSPERERLAAAWLLAAWKFANKSQRQKLLGVIPEATSATSPIRVQALPLLVSAGRSLSEWVSAKPGLAWENAMAAEYLRSLGAGEDKAVGVALSLLDPALRLAPQRFAILPRAIPLIEIVGDSASGKLDAAAPKILQKLRKNPERLRDCRTESIVSPWCP